jgi:dTDP-4-amino-4,6-dideoxygalactose transaminase
VAVNSGTAALHVALLALRIGPGDEVVVPDFTYPATANAVRLTGATPVLVDIDPITFNATAAAMEPAITPHTRVLLPVHLFGQPADMDPILALAAARGLHVIEDAACALGARYHGRPAGALGTLACFSFHPRKAVTTGEGGMVTTDDPALALRLRMLRNHGQVTRPHGLSFEEIGLNYRLTDFQGALGLAQLDRLEPILARRAVLAQAYDAALAAIPDLATPRVLEGAVATWQSYVVMLPRRVERNAVSARLREAGIETTLGTYSISAQPAYAGAPFLANSRAAYAHSLSLPLHPRLSEADVSQVAQCLAAALA